MVSSPILLTGCLVSASMPHRRLIGYLHACTAIHAPMVGRGAIRKGYASQARARAHGKFRLRSRHHVSNLVVRPVEDCPGVVVGVYYLLSFRNPDSDCEAPYLT